VKKSSVPERPRWVHALCGIQNRKSMPGATDGETHPLENPIIEFRSDVRISRLKP
jgi:hypothetical protein